MSKEWIAVIGRIQPIGEVNPSNSSSYEYRERERTSVLLQKDGRPICRALRLERIVSDKAQAEKEFLRLTEGM